MKALAIIYKTSGANIENCMDSLCFPCLLATALKPCTGCFPSNGFSLSGVLLYFSKGSSLGFHQAVDFSFSGTFMHPSNGSSLGLCLVDFSHILVMALVLVFAGQYFSSVLWEPCP
jgi:hypothetical protein